MVEPAIWGPPFWATIHYVALGYPKEPTPHEQWAYTQFFTAMGDVIPCGKCRAGYQDKLRAYPVDASSGDALFEWTVAIHNMVNESTGKPPWTVAQTREYYLSTYPAEVRKRQVRAPPSMGSPPPGSSARGGSIPTTAYVMVGVAAAAVTALVAYLVWKRFRRTPS